MQDSSIPTFYFRRRTNTTSFDPYDCLTTTRTPVASDSYSHYKDNRNISNKEEQRQYRQPYQHETEYWTNGNTVQYLNMPSTSTGSTDLHSTDIGVRHSSVNGDVNTNSEITRHDKMTVSSSLASQSQNQSNAAAVSKSKHRNEVRDSIFAGSIAGMTSCALFHPFDVIRTKMQTSTSISSATATAASTSGRGTATATAAGILTSTANPKATIRNTSISSSSGPLAVISHTYKNGGMRAFYTGITLPIAAQAMYKSTVLTVNRVSTSMLIDWKSKEQRKIGIFYPYQLNSGDRFLCGAISGAVNALLFVCPVEYVRNQLIHQHTKRAQGKLPTTAMGTGAAMGTESSYMRGPIDVIRKTIKTKGMFGLWRGAGVTLVRDSIGCGAFFIANDFGEKNISRLTGHEKGSMVNTIGAGFFAGFGYWFVSLPLDALKTLVQTGKASSATDTFSFLIKRDGIAGVGQLYRGWQVAFGRGSPSAAVTLTTYSIVYNFCERTFV
jgi:hypothetical protein